MVLMVCIPYPAPKEQSNPMTESRPYPPVRPARYEAWRHRIDELDTEYSESMPQEVWSVSPEARLVRSLQMALGDIGNASGRISPYGFVDFSPENDPHGEDELLGGRAHRSSGSGDGHSE